MDIDPWVMQAVREGLKELLPLIDDKLLKDNEAAELLGRSRAKFRAQVRAGELPPPVRDGNMTRWRKSELLAVIARLAAERDATSKKAATS
jgi:predicted DNA-binding transcriptional regulator AlpA